MQVIETIIKHKIPHCVLVPAIELGETGIYIVTTDDYVKFFPKITAYHEAGTIALDMSNNRTFKSYINQCKLVFKSEFGKVYEPKDCNFLKSYNKPLRRKIRESRKKTHSKKTYWIPKDNFKPLWPLTNIETI